MPAPVQRAMIHRVHDNPRGGKAGVTNEAGLEGYLPGNVGVGSVSPNALVVGTWDRPRNTPARFTLQMESSIPTSNQASRKSLTAL
jgi:hypothetical protein